MAALVKRPIIYLRVEAGGEEALRAQESCVRDLLESVGISTSLMHVYGDVDTPGDRVGNALRYVLHDAALGGVDTVIVRDLAAFGHDADLVFNVLQYLETRGTRVLMAIDVAATKSRQGQARRAVATSGADSGAHLSEPRALAACLTARGRFEVVC